jgi:hypothetical protein
MLVEPCWKGQ